MLDVMLTNHLDVLMVLVEQDNKIVQYSLHATHSIHSDANQEDALKMLLHVNNLMTNYKLVLII